MAEVYDLLFGGPGKEALAGCKDIILQATQALLICSRHFVDGSPTPENPYPTLFAYNNYKEPLQNRSSNSITKRSAAEKRNEFLEDSHLMESNEEAADFQSYNDTSDVDEHALFDYGPPAGDPGVRHQLAEFLKIHYNDNVECDNLFITAAATNGIHLATTVLMSRDAPIFVEDPTFFIAHGMFQKDYGHRVIPVQTDDDGIDLDVFEKLLQETLAPTETKYPFRRMLYVMTVHHNPKGSCLPPEKCRRLVSLARKYDVLLFGEDVYNLLTYTEDGIPPLRLLAYDNKEDPDYKGHTISNSTFSKIFSPGLRLGWIETSPRIIQMLKDCYTTASGFCFNHYMSRVVGKALELGLVQTNLARLRKLYGDKIRTACRRLRENQTPVTFVGPKGGFFLWLKLPEKINGKDFQEKAKAENLLVMDGSDASMCGNYKNFIRISISVTPLGQIEKGMDKLCQLIRSYDV